MCTVPTIDGLLCDHKEEWEHMSVSPVSIRATLAVLYSSIYRPTALCPNMCAGIRGVAAVPIQRVKMNFTTGVFNGAGFRIEIVPVPDFLEKNLFCGTNVDDLKERGDFAVCLQKPLLVEGGYSERTKLSTTP